MHKVKKDQLRCLIEWNKFKTELVLQPRGTSTFTARRKCRSKLPSGTLLTSKFRQIPNMVHGSQPLISLYFFFFKVVFFKISVESSD